MYIRRKLFSSGEYWLEEKEFNSKEMKKLREMWDTQIAEQMYGGTEGRTTNIDQLKRVGRRKAKEGTINAGGVPNGKLSYVTYESPIFEKEGTILNALKGNEKAQDIVDTHAIRAEEREPSKDIVDKVRKKFDKINKKNKKEARIKNLKTAGKVALGTAAVAGLAYGGKKAYDHYKNKKKKKEDKEK